MELILRAFLRYSPPNSDGAGVELTFTTNTGKGILKYGDTSLSLAYR